MQLSSPSFNHLEPVPVTCTCDGENISPELRWEHAPEGAKSFALTCFDPDAQGNGFVHWRVYNIPASVRLIPQGALPQGALEVENDFGKTAYGGPCPHEGTHRYLFTLFALFAERLEGLTKENFDRLVEDHALATAELIGVYTRT